MKLACIVKKPLINCNVSVTTIVFLGKKELYLRIKKTVLYFQIS